MKKTTENFIEQARSIHGDKYDYSNVEYVNAKTKVCIICEDHGVFYQTPDKHLNGKCGCPVCAGNKPLTSIDFIEKAKTVHCDKYDYSPTVYVNQNTPVTIICKIHGEFKQLPSNHLAGKGCSLCANNVRLTTDAFINKAKLIHGDVYDYSKVVYKGNRNDVEIICKQHGVFKQRPYVHLSGSGCPVCGRINQGIHRDNEAIYKKSTQTFLRKYGVINPMNLDSVREKQLLKVRSDEVNNKRIQMKRQNQSFNTSLPEYRLGVLLQNQFGKDDVFYNYKSVDYPFLCDYYIMSRNMYIELNAHWSHGGHWYTDDDFDRVQDWLSKTKFYRQAADTFSVRDVNKRRVARMNSLNYVVFWKSDLSDVLKWIECGCPDGKDWDKEYSWL